ncbi:MAG: 1-acyl-sn-glycerol-3-phosphate acyltransferase [Deltaproteobacteria bacterium]|nr:1-acyl-sn-glycerol-3-phosphate acyltransferase [Deltaproteobacteria bacterium]
MAKTEIIFQIKGILSLSCILANIFFWLVPLVFLTFLKLLVPSENFQRLLSAPMALIYRLTVSLDDFLLFRVMGISVEIEGRRKTYPEKFYLITANHQSWSDIFVLQHVFNWRAPIPKFLVKKELIYLPVVNIICLAYDYPLLQRGSMRGGVSSEGHFERDTLSLEKAFARFIRFPATVINLVEGTRFTKEKAGRQSSPYENLLKPKTGGMAIIFSISGVKVRTLIDVTIVYDCERPTFWNFLCGKCGRVVVKVEEYESETLPANRDFDSMAKWINGVWEKKDLEIGRIRCELAQRE